MVKVKEKHIVICADDFGMDSGIDDGILRLAQLKRLNATSCLVEGPSFRRNAAALNDSALQLGLHLNFTESMGEAGLYLPVSSLIVRSYLRRLDDAQVHAQIARQLDLFEASFGRAPDFVDGHQHVHQLPQIRQALLAELTRRYSPRSPAPEAGARACPWLRHTRAGSQSGLPLRLRLKAWIIQSLGSRGLFQSASSAGFSMNAGLLGVYDFRGGVISYQTLLKRWLEYAVDGDEIMCHPAARAVDGDVLGEQRVAEFNVLAGDRAGQWLCDYGIALRV
ncbi:MAG TPA: ChbG/HpnK family deacetylase [Paralcaligenes sp.]